MMTGFTNSGRLLGVAAAVLVAAPASAQVQTYQFDLPAQSLDASLRAFARTTRQQILFDGAMVRGKKAPALRGAYSAEHGLAILLRDSGLTAARGRGGAYVVSMAGNGVSTEVSAPRSVEGSPNETEIVVTGSHIRGSEPVSPVTVARREEIEKRGLTDLGSFARSLVQNYSGGQNPGIPAGSQGGSENVTSSSTLNLRGLGADATLTLFNGHRVAYDAIGQGVDISAVPLAAVDRVEVVADGSSALYGSDAVGGVANIILRRDFDGALASARWGAATDGGDVEQQYDLVSGGRWTSGGVMAAASYRHSTPITAGQRSYTQRNHPSDTLLSGQRQIGLVVAGHQALADGLAFEFDGQFSDRKSDICLNFTVTDGCLVTGGDLDVRTRSWTLSPSLVWQVSDKWEVRAVATIGESKVDQIVDMYTGGLLDLRQDADYNNRIRAFEVRTEGPLFSLPGGDVRFAAGAGVRSNKFVIDVDVIAGGISSPYSGFEVDRSTRYAFGEISLPVISPANGVSLVHRLSLTAAARYEDIRRVGDVTTPKLGVVYAPSADLALKLSWGKSFKAPTLYQTGRPREGYSQVGATFFSPPSPVPGTVLYLVGGNPDLGPERATNWTATLSLTPAFVEGLRIDASYFRIRYKDRAVSPIPLNSLSFLPLYSDYVTLNPTRDQVLAAIANVPVIYNQGGGDVTTANVVAIVTNYLQNAARQTIKGVDISVDYRFDVGARDELRLKAAASYLESEQQLSEGAAVVQQAGIIFRQPHWRASSSLDWQHDNVSLSGVFTFIGGSLDNRRQPFVRVGSFKSVDLVARVETTDVHGPFANLSFGLSLLNVFNEKPPHIRTTSSLGYQYDANNFPSIGRFVSLSISKSF